MSGKLAAILLLASVNSAVAQSPLWGQCGGIGWTGSTSCASGSACVGHHHSIYHSIYHCVDDSTDDSTNHDSCFDHYIIDDDDDDNDDDWKYQSYNLPGLACGTAPYPAIIGYGGGSIPIPAGVAKITFNNDDIAAQTNTGSRGQGKFYTLYGSGHSAGALTAWAWGVSRIIDALEITPGANINTARIGVTGCSRNGKGAIVAGALDDRIALTIPQESGSGGSACWRLSDYQKSQGQNVQTASQIITENVWFSTAFNANVNQVSRLPFDHHSLAGLVAPRGLFVIENTSMEWLGNLSTYGCMKVGSLIYQALGVSSNMGYSQVGHSDHCGFPSSQSADLNAFINRFLLGQSVTTNVFRTDGSFNFNQASWVDWTVPTLT
ncbi:hypothetical protein ABW20_dc0103899 [Dactylellina cionopaga]|nr:hypothetical protein ABW20_dc0103899 [Dactylellina cionopaga]